MSKRIYYSTWGKLGGFSGYAIKRNYEESLSAVCRSIARKAGLAFVEGPCAQGWEMKDGKVFSRTYSATFGKPGLNVEEEIWFNVESGRFIT